MLGIIGKYIGMTSIYDTNGNNIPCSVIHIEPCFVIQIKNIKLDGYNAIQIGCCDKKKNINKPYRNHFIKSNIYPKRKLIEVKLRNINNINLGDKIDISIFNKNDIIDVTGFSKGKGFQGVIKRHNFAGVGEQTHGQHNRLRAPGSIGAGSDPSRVFKGTKMAGRTGNKKVTIKNLKIFIVDKQKNILVIKGAVPGVKNSYIILKKWN